MMIGDENGSHDSVTAKGPLEFIMIGLRKMIVTTSSMITGIAACCTSCTLYTIKPAAANSDAKKLKPVRKKARMVKANRRLKMPSPIIVVGGAAPPVAAATAAESASGLAADIIPCVM